MPNVPGEARSSGGILAGPHGIGQSDPGRYAKSAQVPLACDDRPCVRGSARTAAFPSVQRLPGTRFIPPSKLRWVRRFEDTEQENAPSKRYHSVRRVNVLYGDLHPSARQGGDCRST
jgi:hypothetical protein